MRNLISKITEDKFIHGLIPAFLIHFGLGNMYSWSQITNKIALDLSVDEAQTHWIFATLVFVMGISTTISGRISEYGIKVASFSSLIIFIIGNLISSIGLYSHSFNTLLIGYGVITAIGIGLGYMIPIKNVMLWFPNRSGLAIGLTVLGFSISSLLSSIIILYNYEIDTHMIVLKVLFYSVIPITIGALLIERPKSYVPINTKDIKSVLHDVIRIIKSNRFFIIWLIIFFKLSAGLMIIYNQVRALNYDIMAFDYHDIVLIVILTGVFNGLGRIAVPFIVDKIDPGKKLRINYLIFGLPIVALLFTYFYHEWAIFPVFLCIVSFSYGAGICCIPIILQESFKADNYVGTIQGAMFTSWCVAGLAGASLGYFLINLFSVVTILIATLSMYLAGLFLSIVLMYKVNKEGRYELS